MKNGKEPWKVLFAAAFSVRIAFSLAVGFFASAETGGPFNYPDSFSYQAHARSLIETGRFQEGPPQAPLRANRPPLYPAFLASCQALFGTHRLSWVVPQAVLGAVSCLLLAAIGRNFGLAGAGRTAAWILAIYPPHVAYTPLALTETLFVFLLLAFAATATSRPSSPRACLAGILGALAALTRPGFLLFPPVAFLLAFVLARWPRRAAALALAAYAAALLPWTLRNHEVLGRWIAVNTRLGHDLYEGNCPEATGGPVSDRIDWPDRGLDLSEADRDAFRLRCALRYMAAHPARTAHLATVKILRLWNAVPNDERHRGLLASCAMLATYGAALAAAAWTAVRLEGPATCWTLVLCAYLSALHGIFIGSVRYRLPAEPFLLLLASAALLETRRSQRKT